MSQTTNKLPSDFIWGAATAAYQIEGAGMKMVREKIFGTVSATLRVTYPVVIRET